MKSDFFSWKNSSDHTTFTRWPTGHLQQCTTPSQGVQKTNQQCTAPSQVHRRPCKVLKGSAQLTSGDIGGDAEAQDQFSPREVNPEWVRNPFIPVLEVWTLNDRWCNGDRGAEHTEQWTFVVPGAQNFVKMLKASNYAYSAWCTELCVSVRALLGWSTTMTDVGSNRSDHSFLPFFFYCTAPPLQIRVRVLLFFAFCFFSITSFYILILSISNYTVLFSNCTIKFHLFLSGKLIALATLSSMQLSYLLYIGVFMCTCWTQINTVKFSIGKIKFPPCL